MKQLSVSFKSSFCRNLKQQVSRFIHDACTSIFGEVATEALVQSHEALTTAGRAMAIALEAREQSARTSVRVDECMTQFRGRLALLAAQVNEQGDKTRCIERALSEVTTAVAGQVARSSNHGVAGQVITECLVCDLSDMAPVHAVIELGGRQQGGSVCQHRLCFGCIYALERKVCPLCRAIIPVEHVGQAQQLCNVPPPPLLPVPLPPQPVPPSPSYSPPVSSDDEASQPDDDAQWLRQQVSTRLRQVALDEEFARRLAEGDKVNEDRAAKAKQDQVNEDHELARQLAHEFVPPRRNRTR